MKSSCILSLARLAMLASAGVLLLVAQSNSLRLLNEGEATQRHGGQVATTCAKSVFTKTTGCANSTKVDEFGYLYKCDGTELHQDCTAATYNSGNVCKTGSALCSGPQYWYNEEFEFWFYDSKDCTKVYYTTARLQQGQCVPAPPPPP